jgi:hypothetical protein
MSKQFRLCPSCGIENAPAIMRCTCGSLLAGIDITQREDILPTTPPPAVLTSVPTPARLTCSFDDCGQENPPGSTTCVYCNRPLDSSVTPLPPAGDPVGLLQLPPELSARFRVLQLLPAGGAEAELLRVEPLAGGEVLIAKIYRHGLRPKTEVQTRISRIDPRHCVQQHESGVTAGHAWELMEYCRHGSLRGLLAPGKGPLPAATLSAIADELSTALAAVHAAGLVHRDLKPENVLVRSLDPLDLVLTDFGIASVLDATQRFTGEARTLPYAAPESLSGVIDGKTDYWALGMILLEAACGQHPFAGLSEAVILHHLTTKTIDTSTIADANLRKLVRGLLLRDPKARFGEAEIKRWRQGDPALAEPAENTPVAGFNEAYRLGGDICQTPEQLAVALARHWREGVRDLDNGQLLEWFRSVQKDQNTVRLLIDLRHERQMHVDVQLLRLILHLAPGLPPVWRGESIELSAVLTQANRALKGDAEAAAWLDALYQHHVLEAWAAAGNIIAADLVQRWNASADRFDSAWQACHALLTAAVPQRSANDVVNFDEVVYGRRGPNRPSLMQLHARLLAVAYDEKWSERLRQRLLAELAQIAADSPWLGTLGDPLTMDAAALLVLEALLPEARKTAERLRKAAEDNEVSAVNALNTLREGVATTLAQLKSHSPSFWPTSRDLESIENISVRFFAQAALVRARGEAGTVGKSAADSYGERFQTLRKQVARNEPLVDRIQQNAQDLQRQLAVNAGWLNVRVFGFFGLSLLLLPILFNERIVASVFAAGVAIVAWRISGTLSRARRLRALLTMIE